MGWHLDGRVTAVVGTHTHVPTADARVLPGGTAYITDVGMTGPRGGVIGVKREQAVESLVTQMPVRFETSEDDPWLNGRRDHAPRADARRRRSSRCCARPARACAELHAAPQARGSARAARPSRAGRTTRCRGRTSASRRAGARSAPRRAARRARSTSRRRGHERDDDRERQRAAPCTPVWSAVEPAPQPPDRERRARGRAGSAIVWSQNVCRSAAGRSTGQHRDRRRGRARTRAANASSDARAAPAAR